MRNLLFAALIPLLGFTGWSADRFSPVDETADAKKQKPFTVAFYNVENLFDTENDPAINDEEFLPEGANHWGEKEYRKKLDNLAKVISQLGDADGPEILGLAEIENRRVLNDLVAHPTLKKHKYKVVHRDSPDERGIDVAMLYKEKAFRFLYDQPYQVVFPDNKDLKTRNILLVKGIAGKDQELTIMVNHWPSRRGGAAESEAKRMRAAGVAHYVVDSIMDMNRDANLILVGDFNDESTDKSIHDTLGASYDVKGAFFTHLYNPMYDLQQKGEGSIMYQKQWDLFDQVILSESLTGPTSKLYYKPGSAAIYHPSFIAQQEEGDWKGAPKRSMIKNVFQEDGYSDHFPVYVQLLMR